MYDESIDLLYWMIYTLVRICAVAAEVCMTCMAGTSSSNMLFNKVLSTDPDWSTVSWREIGLKKAQKRYHLAVLIYQLTGISKVFARATENISDMRKIARLNI